VTLWLETLFFKGVSVEVIRETTVLYFASPLVVPTLSPVTSQPSYAAFIARQVFLASRVPGSSAEADIGVRVTRIIALIIAINFFKEFPLNFWSTSTILE
jgi:hypothetical protein